MGQHCSGPREQVLPVGAININPSNPAAAQQAEKMMALKSIINNDGFRRALMKFLQKKNLEVFLNYYFEVEDLAKMEEDHIRIQSEILRERYKMDPASSNLVTKPGFEEAREQWKNILASFENDYKIMASSLNLVSPRSGDIDVSKIPGDKIIDVFRASQDKILAYLSNYLDAFMDSKYYQDVLRSEKQREHDNAKKSPVDLTKAPTQSTELFSAGAKLDTLPHKYRNILLVDDSKIATKIASLALTKAGHTVVVANHGRVALEELARERFHLVLIDLYMPIMDGFETITKFRSAQNEEAAARAAVTSSEVAMPDHSENMSSSQPNKSVRYSFHTAGGSPDKRERIIVVGMSSDGDKETINKAEDAGIDHFMQKPFSIEKLAAIIQSIESNTEWDAENRTNIEL